MITFVFRHVTLTIQKIVTATVLETIILQALDKIKQRFSSFHQVLKVYTS